MTFLKMIGFEKIKFEKIKFEKKQLSKKSNAATLLFLWLLFYSYFFSYSLIHQLT